MLRSLTVLLAVYAMAAAPAPAQEGHSAELLRMHEAVLRAHRDGDLDAWMALEADEVVSANGGRVTFPTAEERRAMRGPYLAGAGFTAYRDLRPPLVRVSTDGTLGWVIAEVEVRGTWTSPEGAAEPIDDVWAWIELYERRQGRWWLIGNVSNRRDR